MQDGGKILLGLLVFLALAFFPFYYNVGKAKARPEPSLKTPEIQKLKVKECVEPKAFMRANHMQMLDEWRDQALRRGQRVYVSSRGVRFDISLQNTCMRCHSNKKKFCDECHNYLAVRPYCWDCHVAPKEKEL
jgi:hypothetical protein